MWPWEHAAVGYLVFSLFCHAYYRESPDAPTTVAVVAASILPDLIDKPLAYEFGVFDTGYALGHSLFFAIPLAVTVGVLARRLNRGRVGLAFGVGYLLHPLGDVVPHYLRGDERVEILLWPVRTVPGTSRTDSLTDLTLTYFLEYWTAVTGTDPPIYLLVQTGVVACTGLLWLYDGAPILRQGIAATRRAVGNSFGSRPR